MRHGHSGAVSAGRYRDAHARRATQRYGGRNRACFRGVGAGPSRRGAGLSEDTFTAQQGLIVQLAARNRLPAIYARQTDASVGVLMTYATTPPSLAGSWPMTWAESCTAPNRGEIPIYQPTLFKPQSTSRRPGRSPSSCGAAIWMGHVSHRDCRAASPSRRCSWRRPTRSSSEAADG